MSGQTEVKLANDVYRCCFHHALSSQAEEVMGILIGEKISEKDGTTVIEVSALRIVPRLDKRKDRVEISDDQIIKTTQVAEDLALKLKKPNLRVVGWYHSHPNITVWPSHVDLRTQFNYQRLDDHFIGLIFSVYNVDRVKKTHQYEVIAFQAQEDENNRDLKQLLVPIEVTPNDDKMSPHVAEEMVRLSEILCQENEEMAMKMAGTKSQPTKNSSDYSEKYGEEALATLEQDFAMQMGATSKSEDFEEDYGAVDIMSSLERDIALQMSYATVFKHVTLPTLEQLESEMLPMKIPDIPVPKVEPKFESVTEPQIEPKSEPIGVSEQKGD